jgi:hypothetical protein
MLALDRNEAKQVFQTKESTALAQLIEAQWQDASRTRDGRNLDLGCTATTYGALLENATSLDDAAKALLSRGGRRLPSEDRAELFLLRPDLVGPLSMAAASIDKLGVFLAAAAARGEAVVIAY